VIVDEEFFRLAPDGSRRSFSCSSAPVYGEKGQIVEGVVVSREITEQKRSQEQSGYLLAMLNHTEDAIIAFDPRWRATAWNKGAERMYGWSAEEVLGRALPRSIGVELSGKRIAEVRRETAEHGHRRAEVTAYRKDGSRISVEALHVAIRDEHSKISGYLAIHRDITERKRAEERLAYHTRLLDNMHDAVLVTDPDFVLNAWNLGAERMFGWTAAEALGHKVHERIPTSFTDEELAAEMGDLMKAGRWRGDATWYGKHGRPVEAEGLAVAVRSDQGQVSGYVCIMRDISALRQSELELASRLRQQAAVAEFGLEALAVGRLQPLIDGAMTLVCRTLEVEYAKVEELVPDREELLVRAGAGWAEGIVGSYRILADRLESPAGYALALGEPVIVDNVATETRFEIPRLLRDHDVVSAITVVIDPGGTPFGTLAALSTRPRAFSEHDVSFVQSVANVIATAAERARADERVEAARETERSRIARDLHDEALRELSDALALAMVGRSSSLDEGGQRRWDRVIGTLQRSAQQMRGAIYDLRLSSDDGRPFGDLLSELVAVQDEMAGDCHVQLHGRRALGAILLGEPGIEVLRIVTEALTNARRHSGCTTSRVDVTRSTPEFLWLEVSDDGSWPDRESAVRSRVGTGITSMFTRAEALGATLSIQSPGGGTTVSLELSLATPRSDA
jgi:PAS domain S-box-containing protein